MSTPYHFSPRVPPGPHPTPLSSSSYSVSHAKHTRPPIYNPYDKFTQPEFDTWIGGITGALRKALGQVDDEPTHKQVPPEQHAHGVGSRGSSIEEEDDSLVPEDSFSEIKARRAMGKGKARDPREGPGLQGVGDKEQPIEILSDEEEEEEAHAGSEGEQEENEEEWDENVRSGDEEEGDGKLSWYRGQRPSGTGLPGMRERPIDDEYDEEEDYEEDSGEEAQPRRGSSEVIELSDSDDIVQPRQTLPQQQHPQIQPQQRQFSAEEEDYEEEYSGEESYEEDEEPSLTLRLVAQQYQLQYQNGGLSPELVEDEDDEIQPEDDDTSFPPHSSLRSTDTAAVDIPDPWKGPQTYAEDFYSGGDAALRAPRDAHRLGPGDSDYEGFLTPGVGTLAELEDEEEGEGEVWDEEEEQEQEQLRRREEEPEIIAVDSDEEEEEEGVLKQPQRQQDSRYEEVLDDEEDDEEEEEEEDQLPRSSPPVSSPIVPPTMLPQSILRPQKEVLEFDALYDDMETAEVVEDNQREQAEIISDLVDWNYPPAFPTGVPASAPGHLATPSSEEEEDAAMGNATFMSVHMESSVTSPFGRQESVFVHFESTPRGPTAAPPIDLDADEEYDEEEEEGEMDLRDMPLGTSDLDVRDLGEEEEDIMEVVKPGEVVEAEEEEQDENEKAAERAMSAVEEVVVEEETYETGVSEPGAPYAGADEKDTSPGITIVEDTEEVQATTELASPAAASSPAAAAMEADTSGETASVEELGEVKEPAAPEAEPEVMEVPKPSENIQDAEEIQPVEDIEEVEEVQSAEVAPTLEYADILGGVLDMGAVTSEDEDEFMGMVDLQYPEEVQSEVEEVQPGVEEVQEVQFIEAEVQPVEEVQPMEEEMLAGPSTAADQPEPTQQEPVASAPQPMPAAAPLPHYPIYDIEQLPTPPSERMHTTELPPTTEFEDAFPYQTRHPVEMEEIQDEDATPPGSSAQVKFTIPEDMDLELETSMGRKIKKLQADPRGYLVDEAQSPEEKKEQLSDEDADWEVDWEVEVASVSSGGIIRAEDEEEEEREAGYTVEEPLTETDRWTTEEPSTRATSLRVASVDTEGREPVSVLHEKSEEEADIDMDEVAIPAVEAETFHAPAIDTSAPPMTSPEDASNITFEVVSPTPQEQKFPEEQEPPTTESQAEEFSAHPAQASSSGTSVADDALVPVSAGASVPDVTGSPTRQAQPLVINLPGTPTFMLSPAGTPGTGPTPVSIPVPQSILQALKQHGNYRSRAEAGPSGLFTPGERSGAATPNILLEMPQGGVDTSEDAEGSGTTQDQESTLEAGANQHAADASQETLPADERLTMLEHLAGVSGSATVVGAEDDGLKSTEPAVDVFGSVESTEASQLAAAAFALARQAQTRSQSSSLAYRAPSSFDHPMRVPMSRRQSTDPILVGDPYPASLSTPVLSFPYTKEEESSEGTEQENSMSSSSTMENHQDQEDEETVTDNILNVNGIGDFEYQVEPHVSQPFAESPAGPSTTQTSPAVVGGSGDVDADRDVDLESPNSSVSPVKQSPQVPKSTPDVMKEEDPFKLMGTDSTVAPGVVQEDVSPVESKSKSPESTPELVAAEKPNPSPPLQVQEAEIPTNTPKPESISEPQPTVGTEAPDPSSRELSGDKPFADGPSAEAADISTKSTPLPSKRKRARSPAASRLPRTVSTKKASKTKGSSVAKESKAKTKSNDEGHGDTIAVKQKTKEKEKSKAAPTRESSVDSSSSGASAAAKLLLRPGSRSSSVASTAPSDKSLVIQPSPTVNKPPTTGVPLPPPPPPPLFHAHGNSRNKTQAQPPPLTVQQQLHRQMPRVPSFTRTGEQQLPSPSSAHSPHPPLTPRTSSAASSPVTRSTRSQCRYHKISLPKEEGGPRVCFLVPGCSLTDKKLMNEEEIEDHGDATHEDSNRMVQDIGSLDFDAYLIGILRQLVGVDILREQEVFYLPSPGEEVPRRLQHRRTASERASLARVPEGTTMGSPSLSTASFRSPTSSKAPASIAGSTGTSGSILRRARDSDKDTHSNYTETESEFSEGDGNDDGLPKAKRSRPSPPDENADPVAMGPPASQSQSTKRSKSRRGKRLTADYLSYKPESDREETSVDEDESRLRRKRPAKRGIKRARTTGSVVAENADGRKSKKLKSHASDVTERTTV